MFISVNEVYESSFREFELREILINTDHIGYLREDPYVKQRIKESNSLKGLDERVEFTRVFLNRGNMGFEVVVVGSLDKLQKDLDKKTKTLLKD